MLIPSARPAYSVREVVTPHPTRHGSGATQSTAPLLARAWLHGLIVAAVAVGTYAPSMRNLYTLDDMLVSTTALDREHAPVSTLFDRQYFSRYNQDTYRPVATLTSMIDHRIGVDPRHAGHAQNILWQAGTALLVFLLGRRWLPSTAALVAGLFFAVHPGATEATLAIGYREDAVVAFLLVASLLLTWRGTLGSRVLALLCYGLALFTKENAIVFPALLALARLTLERDGPLDRRAVARELAAFALVTVGYLGIRFGVMASPFTFADHAGGTYDGTLVAVPRIFTHYLRVLVAPWPLLVLYDHMFPLGASLVSQLPWLVLDLAFVAGAVWLARKWSVLGFGLLWFAIALAPVLHFVPMRVTAADRFIHVSLVGGAIAAGALFALAQANIYRPPLRRALHACAALALVVLLGVTERRIPVWHDDLSLWTDTLRHNPRAYIGHFFLASRAEADGNLDGARHELELAVADCPRESRFGRERFCSYFASKLGFLLLRRNDRPAARAAFIEALAFVPDYAIAYVGLGHLALGRGDLEGARDFVAAATRVDSRLPAVRDLIADLRADIARAAREE
jgi:hypothetical protein